jgi:hypothetical protein
MQNSTGYWRNFWLFKKDRQSKFIFFEILILSFIFLISLNTTLAAQHSAIELDPDLHHLRTTESREWSEFPLRADQKKLRIQFNAEKNQTEYTLQVRQLNVKQTWQIELNNSYLTHLHLNEYDLTSYFPIPAGMLNNGENELLIHQANQEPDDILVGEIKIHRHPLDSILNEGTIQIDVIDQVSGRLLPSRITIVNDSYSLQSVGASSRNTIAVRPGAIYTGNGSATFGLPKGEYTIYAGRGMEYGVDSTQITISGNQETLQRTLSIRHEVDTNGYISSDTHIHTFTHSGHGDATADERMLTIAGEGIELPITTEHNQHVDYSDVASNMRMTDYFTTVTGNEVTTPLGHFNVFPVEEGSTPPNTQIDNWSTLFSDIYDTPGVSVVILNHGRDDHGGFTPLNNENFNALTGEFLEELHPQFNAMEVVNSGAHQSDMMQLFRDWFTMTNRGYDVTPIGSSDAHDVNRYILGQARTFIQLPDEDPSNINIVEAAKQLVDGKVAVGMGLFTEISVNGTYGPGNHASINDSINVHVKVQGPDWVDANVIELYRNGEKIRSEKIESNNVAGTKWEGSWTLEKYNHDSFLVAIARGPGIKKPYWPIARPYQPDTIEWNPEVIGATGAVWLDEDGNGEKNSAYEYAKDLVELSEGSLEILVEELERFDQAVAIQAAGILFDIQPTVLPLSDEMDRLIQSSSNHVREGFEKYLNYLEQTGEL